MLLLVVFEWKIGVKINILIISVIISLMFFDVKFFMIIIFYFIRIMLFVKCIII